MRPHGKGRRYCGALALCAVLVLGLSSATDQAAAADNLSPPPVHHAVTTGSPRAQSLFDEGLTHLYAFNVEAAHRSFEAMARTDPGAPMAYWGLAMAAGPNINVPRTAERDGIGRRYAAAAATLLQRPAARASAEERAWIAAIEARFARAADGKAADIAWRDAMGRVAAQWPDDLDAATLFGEAGLDLFGWSGLFQADGTSAKPGAGAVLAALRDVLARDPHHIGAAHFLIHSLDDQRHAPEGLGPARMLEGYAYLPEDSHLAHMPSHILFRLGLYDEGAVGNLRAVALDREAFRALGTTDDNRVGVYHFHNVQSAMLGLFMAGRSTEALALGRQESGPFLTEALLAFGQWPELSRMPPDPAAGCIGSYARLAALPVPNAPASGRDTGQTDDCQVLDLMGRARQARRAGDQAAEIQALERATQLWATFSASEPTPLFFASPRLALGGALLRAHRWNEAATLFRADLDQFPQSGRALFGLWQSLAGAGRPAAAERAAFEQAWRHADVPLTADTL